MKTLLSSAILSVLTFATVGAYPTISTLLNTNDPVIEPLPIENQVQSGSPIIDVVFVLDTTSSMSGLIQTAKEKIWSIATTMSSAQQTPEIRIGLVGFRDRGDDYVTQLIDLSSDIDSVYASLMGFEAAGGGDGPESVNQALYEAVHKMSWSQNSNAYQTVFLVGDAPPHMDYKNDVQYPDTLAEAKRRGIVVNAIQSGDMPQTASFWQSIAQIGGGRYLQVGQAGGSVAVATPYDAEMAELAAQLDDTRLYYGSSDEQARMKAKTDASDKLKSESSVSALARRGAFNATASGRKNLLGEQELVDAVSSGSVALEDIEADALPSSISALEPLERKNVIAEIAIQRNEIQTRLTELSEERSEYIETEVSKDSDAHETLDHQLFDTIREQAAKAGLEYRDGPSY